MADLVDLSRNGADAISEVTFSLVFSYLTFRLLVEFFHPKLTLIQGGISCLQYIPDLLKVTLY